MWQRIDRELAAIEREHSVRVLIAVESGKHSVPMRMSLTAGDG
jgi:hypothetical protein